MAILPLLYIALSLLWLTHVTGGGVYPALTSKPAQNTKRSTAGLRRVGSAIVAPYNNAIRQLVVNQIALEHGAGTGTGQFYGVPGTWINADTVMITKQPSYNGDPRTYPERPSYSHRDIKGYPDTSVIYVLRAASNDQGDVSRRYVYRADVRDTNTRPAHLWYYAIGNDLYQDSVGTRQIYHDQQSPKYLYYYYNMLQSYGLAVPRKD